MDAAGQSAYTNDAEISIRCLESNSNGAFVFFQSRCSEKSFFVLLIQLPVGGTRQLRPLLVDRALALELVAVGCLLHRKITLLSVRISTWLHLRTELPQKCGAIYSVLQ